MKKEKDNIKATSSFSYSQALQKKYPKLDGTSNTSTTRLEGYNIVSSSALTYN